MTEEQRFSNREIQLMLENIKLLLKEIKEDIANTNTNFDKRVTRLESEVEALKTFQTRAMVVWVLISVFIGWIVNNIKYFI